MNCKDFMSCMEDFIDGDLGKKLKEECESHIKECQGCMEKAMNFEKCIEFFKCCMPDTKPPEGMKGWMSRFMTQCCGK
ncbi:MAG: zf-HC2 domain-containing protein [Nitrospinae bacterium]|nr:zf-HC2 domain-containing protein [Nitrospinota bacterium]